MERAAEQAEEFSRGKIQSSSSPGHRRDRNRVGNQKNESVLLPTDLNSCLFPEVCGLQFAAAMPSL